MIMTFLGMYYVPIKKMLEIFLIIDKFKKQKSKMIK